MGRPDRDAPRRARRLWRARPALLLVLAAVVVSCTEGEAPPSGAAGGLSLVSTLGGLDTAGYERATEVRTFSFPDDHGPHRGFRTEWWYVTGNLTSERGQAFGFQFTIFRSALSPTPPGGPSTWATNQAYMGHFAVTDVTGGELRAAELFARDGGGLAGARTTPLRVWIEDWELSSAGSPTFPLRLAADGDGFSLELLLRRGKPPVLQGDRGLSQKGRDPGNASYYYAHTRMPAEGRLIFADETHQVSGLAWMDREWSTSALESGQVGWDWFAFQLADGWEMMVYQLRREDGSADPLSDGVLIDPEGRRIPLELGTEVFLTSTGRWSSPMDGVEYPSGWRITVPERGWDLTVEPLVLDQELRLAFRYWEGAVAVRGTGEGGAPVEGRGYVELTGYADLESEPGG